MNLSHINELDAESAEEAFLKCCGSKRWASSMVSARPYSTEVAFYEHAELSFRDLARIDWLDAFAAHPRIGDIESLKQKYGNTRDWAQNEQSGVQLAADDVLTDLAAGNRAYEERFGYIFIVCATGKSAAEMLEILRSRANNDAEKELQIASEEQIKITKLRLAKL